MKLARLIPILAMTFLGACATQPTKSSNAAPAKQAAHPVKSSYPTGKPRPGSKFAKIRIGMGPQEVEGLIGPPTSENSHVTGKQFIPFYFGGDTYRTDWYYRGEGELTFSQAHYGSSEESLRYIRVNRKDTGYTK